MTYLVGSIILTSYLTLFFKGVERFRISNFQTISAINWLGIVLSILSIALIAFG